MAAENNDYLSRFVKYASRKSSKVLFGFGSDSKYILSLDPLILFTLTGVASDAYDAINPRRQFSKMHVLHRSEVIVNRENRKWRN